MRILYSFPHALGEAGIGSTAYNQVETSIRRGHQVTVFCTSLARALEGAHEVVRTLTLAGRRVPHRALGVDRAYRYHDQRVARAVRARSNDFDLVHCWPRASLETCLAARDTGLPSFREVPNTHTAHAFDVVTREVERLGLEAVRGHSHTFDRATLEREVAEYDAADVLLVPSEVVRETFSSRGYPPGRLALHRYGFDPEAFPTPQSVDRPDDAGLVVAFVGRCEPRKGLHLALRAWHDSGAAQRGRFVICGAFVPGYRESIATLLDHPSITIHGFVADPGAVMRDADALVLPALEEGSAVVTYEAQASGCLLLVSDAAGARCENDRQGLVHRAGDVASLTEHTRLLDQDAQLRRRLRRGALDARDSLTWAAAGAELETVYRTYAAARASTSDARPEARRARQ